VTAGMEIAVIALITVSIAVAGLVRAWRGRRQVAETELAWLRAIMPSAAPLRQRRGAPPPPAVAGWLRGFPAGLELVTDTLVMRRLPQQLLVLRCPMRPPAGLALEVVRAGVISPLFTTAIGDGTEGPLNDEGGHDVAVRPGDGGRRIPAGAQAAVQALFGDENVQQLLLAPDGLRLVYKVGAARRGPYTVTRKVGIDRISPADPGLRAALATTELLVQVLGAASRQAEPAACGPARTPERSGAA
jgi:hypothetical protein